MTSPLRRIFRAIVILLGYATAVAVATPVTVIVFRTLAAYLDDLSFESAFSELYAYIFGGVMIMAPTAFPGFVLVVAIASARRWRAWWRFALAGVLNVFPSMVFYMSYIGAPPTSMYVSLLVACLPGGFAGGLAYWAIAGRHSGSRRDAATP